MIYTIILTIYLVKIIFDSLIYTAVVPQVSGKVLINYNAKNSTVTA